MMSVRNKAAQTTMWTRLYWNHIWSYHCTTGSHCRARVMTPSTAGGFGGVAFIFYEWLLATLFTSEAPHTWEEPLASLHSVVTHTEVSAGVNHRLLIHKTHIVFHLFAQTKDVVALCDYRGHVAGTKSQEGRL